MQKLPISVTIVAKNEVDRIHLTLLSVRDWVDEVIVVDSGSTDGTQALAEKLGATVVYNEWKGFGFQKRYAAGLCRNDWVFNLDADEEVSPELRDEIIQLFTKAQAAHPGVTPAPLPHTGYITRISMVLPYERKPRPFGHYMDILRLYDRRKAASVEKDIYDQVIVREGSTGRFKHVVNHYSLRSYLHQVEKINSYTTHHANDVVKSGRRISTGRILIEPFFSFFKSYFVRRYVMYGLDGFLQSLMYSFARTLRMAKIHEQQQAQKAGRDASIALASTGAESILSQQKSA